METDPIEAVEPAAEEPLAAGWTLCAGGETFMKQVNRRWRGRDHASDGTIGDSAHQTRLSDHNPDKNRIVHATDIDEDLKGSPNDSMWLADQLIAYARTRKPNSNRLKYVVYENRVASGTYAKTFWTWRDGDWGHEIHMHVSYTTLADRNGSDFELPIFNGKSGVWDGKAPFYDVLQDAIDKNRANLATFRLACRLAELGFYTGEVQPNGTQKYPKNAVKEMQRWMGWAVGEYTAKTHKAIFKELRNSPN